MLGLLAIAIPCCNEAMRVRFFNLCRCVLRETSQEAPKTFELFWYTHHLFLIFLIFLCFHGAWKWLRAPMAWYYVIPGLGIYCMEKVFRGCNWRWRNSDETITEWLLSIFFISPMKVNSATRQHFSGRKKDALELWIEKPPNLKFMPGQYCFINCPAISSTEWHPFTLTSPPSDDQLKFHIAAVGDWTTQLFDMFPKGWEADANWTYAANQQMLTVAPKTEAKVTIALPHNFHDPVL